MSEFKVGDTVRIVGNDAVSNNNIGDVGVIVLIEGAHARVKVDGGPDTVNWSKLYDLELVGDTPHTIHHQARDRMEYHMARGEYTRAVKWAQVAEMIKEIEDE